jgi:hypothetical protein
MHDSKLSMDDIVAGIMSRAFDPTAGSLLPDDYRKLAIAYLSARMELESMLALDADPKVRPGAVEKFLQAAGVV